jgi:hypothetical protein
MASFQVCLSKTWDGVFSRWLYMNDSSVGPLAWVNGSDAPEKA